MKHGEFTGTILRHLDLSAHNDITRITAAREALSSFYDEDRAVALAWLPDGMSPMVVEVSGTTAIRGRMPMRLAGGRVSLVVRCVLTSRFGCT